MQSQISPPRLRSKVRSLPADSRIAAHGNQPAFEGTIASACELIGISLGKFIEMVRWARESDPKVAQFLDEWDSLGPAEQHAKGAADAVCERVGLAPVELLRAAGDTGCRVSMYMAQIIAAVSHPRVVEKTVERALTDKGFADRMVLHKATGFLPTPKGSQTMIAITQASQGRATIRSVAAPRPEDTIRGMIDCFNQARGLPPMPGIPLPKTNAAPSSPEGPETEEDHAE